MKLPRKIKKSLRKWIRLEVLTARELQVCKKIVKNNPTMIITTTGNEAALKVITVPYHREVMNYINTGCGPVEVIVKSPVV